MWLSWGSEVMGRHKPLRIPAHGQWVMTPGGSDHVRGADSQTPDPGPEAAQGQAVDKLNEKQV